jgi:DNA polymerase-3 subunit gamma/tau
VADASPAPAASAPAPGDEPYQSLYRRYRPQRFDEVRGQEHVTRALRNAVRDERVAHAYLFSGPRGTGKTSTARILAMALNCAHPSEGEPDGVCRSCLEIRRGASLDVQELDAASNRKLDEMRDLLSRVSLGTIGRWKVYIVDEVHQLTSDAASALLKTLEEPPAHVIFVLATTDPQKVLPTIRSRTQHFEFRLLGADVLGGLLRDVNEQAALGLAPEAIDLVVRRGHGSARDALSVLDQVAAAGDVEDEAGLAGTIVDAVAGRDAGRVLTAVAEAVSSGRDPRRLAGDLLDHLRNGFLATQARSLVLLPDDAVIEVEEQARRLGLAGVVRAMEVVGQAAVDMRDAVDPRVTLEVALVRLAAPRADESTGALLRRLEQLESQVEALTLSTREPGAVNASGPQSTSAPAPSPGPAAAPATSPGQAATPPPTTDLRSAGPPTPAGPPGRDGPLPRSAERPTRPAVPPSRQGVGDPPPQPGRGTRSAPTETPSPAPASVTGRAALGAHRRAAPVAVPGPAETDTAPNEPDPGGAPDPRPRTAGLPSRDELTKAWGDDVLPALPTAVKAYVSSGRFVEVDGTAAVYAVPDRGLLVRAQSMTGQIETALAARFGRPVPIRLVLDGESPPVAAAPPIAQPDDDPASYDLNDLRDAGPAVVSPEQRLLEAFPGAEEVTP